MITYSTQLSANVTKKADLPETASAKDAALLALNGPKLVGNEKVFVLYRDPYGPSKLALITELPGNPRSKKSDPIDLGNGQTITFKKGDRVAKISVLEEMVGVDTDRPEGVPTDSRRFTMSLANKGAKVEMGMLLVSHLIGSVPGAMILEEDSTAPLTRHDFLGPIAMIYQNVAGTDGQFVYYISAAALVTAGYDLPAPMQVHET